MAKWVNSYQKRRIPLAFSMEDLFWLGVMLHALEGYEEHKDKFLARFKTAWDKHNEREYSCFVYEGLNAKDNTQR